MGRRYGILCALWLWTCAGCADRQRPAALAVPGLDPAAAAALAEPGSPRCAAFLRSVSTDRLLALRVPLLDAWAQEGRTVAPAVDAIDTELAAARGLASYRDETSYLRALPDSTVRQVLAARREALAVFAAVDPDLDGKLARIGSLQARLLGLGDEYGALRTWQQLTTLEQRSGHPERAETCRRRWVHHATRLGRLDERCRGYSQVMMARMFPGWTPAERDTMGQLIEQASAAGLARASSSLVSVQAYGAFSSGQFHTARMVFQDAIELGARLGEPASALTAMVFLMRMYAVFECWDQVAALGERAAQLLDEAATWESAADLRLTRLQLRTLEARRLAARRRVDEAGALFAANLAASRELPFEEGSFVCRQWADAMIERDRPDLAATAVAAAESLVVTLELPALRARLPYWRAWLAWRGNDPEAATRHLDEFSAVLSRWPDPIVDLTFRSLALRAQLEAPQDRDRAWLTLLDGWRKLQERLLLEEKDAEAYLDLGRNPHLRWAAHELAAGEPDLGYGLDLMWRDAMSSRGRALVGITDLRAAARERTATARRQLATAGAVHCLYRIGPRGVTRWTADGARVVQEDLAAPVDTLRQRVEAALTGLATDPGALDAPIGARLADGLATLAADLLPDGVRQPATAPPQLAVTGDGFLAQFPFAALNVGTDGRYLPLAATTSIVWRRHGLAAVAATGREELRAVGDPALGAATCRRFSLAAGLPGARAEIARVAGRFPGAVPVTGAAATAARVRELWDTAEIFYFAGHAVNDVQVPFVSWLPLGAGDDVATYPGLGFPDILGHAFRRCRVVVLSGCATGRPYVDGLSVAPSLGDAFLDAGASATIQTFWPLRDQDPLIRLESVLAAWRDQGLDLASALAVEQRRALAGPNGARHPFWWATWSVALSGAAR